MNGWRGTWLWRALMVAWSALSVVVVSLTCCLMAPILGARRAFFGIGKWWIRQQFFLSGVKWSVSGWEDLPAEIREERQPVIFMCNHASLLDPPFLTYIIPIPAVYIAKKEVRWMPGVGWAVWAAGMIFIDRKNRERAIQSLKLAAQKIRGGKNVVIFPEGTRTRSGQLLPFKKGGFNLAMDAGVPIVPLAIDGTFEVFPPGAKMMRPGTVRARFGQPLSP
ncbi:MAG: 1-acyl-sn-glycerol-3-phosphate acyltransferase, partial [Firmicutes bacterium]|nr:1-acyl-sn-glycerol-3-phosphate acyltransferase [Bacillota bacterium]